MPLGLATTATLIVSVAARPLVHQRDTRLGGNGTVIPIIKHFSFLNADNTVNLHTLDAHAAYLRAKILRGFKNHEMNTGMTHPAAVDGSRTRKRANGAGVALTSHTAQIIPGAPLLWYTTISIGTPPKSFAVQVDTGSSDLFVPLYNCRSCSGHTLWNPTKDSSTFKATGRRFNAKFEDKSSASGYLYTDNVTVAGFTATVQTIGGARRYSSELKKAEFPPDGMMGMAFKSLSSAGDNTIFETLVAEKKVTDRVFSFKLTKTGGEFYIGGSNNKLYKDPITFNHVTDESYWQVTMQGIEGKGKRVMGEVEVIIDTGSALVSGDPMQVAELHKALGGKLVSDNEGGHGYYYTYPCESFPRVSLIFGGRPFEIPAELLNVGPLAGGPPDDCVMAIAGLSADAKFWTIGGIFLQSVYTVFDLGNLQVGFAELR